MSEEEKQRDKRIYEIIVDRYEQEWKRGSDLDSKANNVIGFSGLLTALTAGFLEFFPETTSKGLFIVPLTFLIVSAILGLCAYWVRSYSAIDPVVLIQNYKEKTETEVIRAYTATISKNTIDNHLINEKKANLIIGAFVSIIIAISLFFAFSIINLVI